MQKAGFRRITILVLMVCFSISNALIAQTAADTLGFKWKLLEVVDPTAGAKVQFTPLIPAPSEFTSWNFGDGSTSTTDSIAIHSYTTVDTFNVSFNFKINSKDSTITRKVFANSAAFYDRLDTNTKATYVRIFRSAFLFPQNDKLLLANMRFEWSVNGNILSDNNFDSPFGQYPNIRYTFENGGVNTVTLKAWNILNPIKTITFTRQFDILPNPITGKAQFTNVPNVFTPNGDNIFDFFEVSTNGLSRLVFKVFSRSGSLVYQNQSYYIKWDGKNDNGKDLPEGIYYYIIEDLDGFYENTKGFVYIFRGN
ncbi:MAG: gliding motility-associated C-terminal domain-containing protein [Bacteroidales bacterium]|nr:gliding motility-associated C-terminal domain-containing protein [Bacteroidales bacterium]